MPSISKIRLTNVVYEGGKKRYNDEMFLFDGHNGAILLENGGGKTVFIQTVLQAVLPHVDMADRKIRETLSLTGTPAHIAVEWILSDFPRRYAVTAVTLFMSNNELDSIRYVYEYGEGDANSIDQIPFVKAGVQGKSRPAGKDEVHEYYQRMSSQHMNAKLFSTIKSYRAHLESEFKIISSEWRKIAKINSSEGDVEAFFEECNTTSQLVDRLLIPAVEDGMAGSGSVQFAETFEKQRDHFKASKQLRRQIHESRMVEDRIRQYLQVFQEYDVAEKELLRDKEAAKALHTLSVSEWKQLKHECMVVQQNKGQAERDLEVVKRKKASREIRLGEQNLQHLQDQKQVIARKLDEQKTALRNAQHQQLTFEYAKFAKRRHDEEMKKEVHERRLDQLEENEDTIVLQEEKEKNTRQIKGVYEESERKLEQKKSFLGGQLDRQRSLVKQVQLKVEALNTQISDLHTQEAISESKTKQTNAAMERIAKRILNNPLHEKVEDMLAVWKQQIEVSMKNQRSFADHISSLNQKITTAQTNLETKSDELSNFQEVWHEYKNRLDQVAKQESKVRDNLQVHFPKLGSLDSLYPKQSSIEQTLYERSAMLDIEKEELLKQERRVTRLSDEYRSLDFFVADPDLLENVKRWKDQFDDLEFGTQVLQEVCLTTGMSEEAMYERYAYWANSLVTTEHETSKLTTLLEKVSHTLRNPVLIVTHTEVRQLVEGKPLPEISMRQVLPTMWRDHLRSTAFAEWKTSLMKTADETSNDRKQKEQELQKHQVLVEQVQNFFAEFPREFYMEWKGRFQESGEQVERLEREINELNILLKKLDQERYDYQGKQTEEEIRQQLLGQKVLDAAEYLEYKSESEEALRELRKCQEKLQKARDDLQKEKHELRSMEGVLHEIEGTWGDVKDLIYRLQGEELYQEVRDAISLPSNQSIDLLRVLRRDLNERLLSIQKGRSELESAIHLCRTTIKQYDEELEIILKKAEQPIDTMVEFPLGGEDVIKRLVEQMRVLHVEVEKIQTDNNDLDRQVDALNARLTEKINRFHDDFPEQEIDRFALDLEIVKDKLMEEEKVTTQRIKAIHHEEDRLLQECKEVERVVNLLEAKHHKHEFLQVDIRDVQLAEGDRLAYPYGRFTFAEQKVAELDQKHQIVIKQRERLDKEKENFKEFCGNSLQDIRLRERTISGIVNKQDYQEVSEWATKMSASIAQGIRLLEEDLSGHDEQLQHFIAQIHTHLQKVAQELRSIPSKTRVRVEKQSKEIFMFTIPEWQEQVGKQKLRSHIDWMIAHLDSDQFKDGENREDIGKMKKWIFDALQSKQLLHVVMGDEEIRVKCRKVSNDGNVSGSPTSWEESNKWSGGEKWSKNMTLFLGILNYLAEKKQAIAPHNERHRTVIMDNPFGKASSEHVLDPVFFIANQLGFQLIALTAHTEGKFIRDYFPIVYSCRLREAVRGDVSILTKDKEIKHAFFRDHDPQAMLRLTQHEQLSLFDKSIL